MSSQLTAQQNARLWLVVAIAISAACTAVVVATSWISDDGLITMRYAHNLLHGHGPVFNLGERVQGYTHPLWFVMLTFGLAIDEEPFYVAVLLGSVFTFLTALVALHGLRAQTQRWLLLGALLLAVWLASDAWRSFQTGGLENSLSHLLIALLVVEISRTGQPRSFALSFLASLLVLSRPDLALLVAPLALPALYQALRDRKLLGLLLGSAPVVAWLAFAVFYYGDPVPNTANAKIGIYTTGEALDQGLRYVVDFATHEPVTVVMACLLLTCAVIASRNVYQRALAVGVVLYLGYVVFIGGDFMRGRFLLPVFVTSSLLGVFALASMPERWKLKPVLTGGGIVILLAALLAQNFAIPRTGEISADGIVNERNFYPGYHLQQYLKNGHLQGPALMYVDDLRAFAGRCGPFTVHAVALGAGSYYAGPKVSVIDLVGLTDEYIASLPRSTLEVRPRPGHPARNVPISYLASRRDITLFSNWHDAVFAGDCGIIAATAAYESAPGTYRAGQDDAVLPKYQTLGGDQRR